MTDPKFSENPNIVQAKKEQEAVQAEYHEKINALYAHLGEYSLRKKQNHHDEFSYFK